jgi:isopentenyl-diphosphate Delta-isomerase
MTVDSLRCVPLRYRYRAMAADGTVENEICPVFCARTDASVRAAPDEVMDWRWGSWDELRAAAQVPWVISPWAAEQVSLLQCSPEGRLP